MLHQLQAGGAQPGLGRGRQGPGRLVCEGIQLRQDGCRERGDAGSSRDGRDHLPGRERVRRASAMSRASSGLGNSRLSCRKSFKTSRAVVELALCSTLSMAVFSIWEARQCDR